MLLEEDRPRNQLALVLLAHITHEARKFVTNARDEHLSFDGIRFEGPGVWLQTPPGFSVEVSVFLPVGHHFWKIRLCLFRRYANMNDQGIAGYSGIGCIPVT